jgi:hypothetical protein
MTLSAGSPFSRRRLLAGAATFAGMFRMSQSGACAQATNQASFNRNSAPSELRITNMRFVLVASKYDYPIIRIDTNQGVYGLGEARDAGRGPPVSIGIGRPAARSIAGASESVGDLGTFSPGYIEPRQP